MNRFHLNLKVADLQKSRAYYARLFGAPPTVEKPDYIKWMLDDPYINFSIEPTSGETGIAHVGIEASDPAALQTVYGRIQDAAGPRFEEGETTCCYAHSEKNWTSDPDGIIWEAFYTDGETTDYGKVPDLAGAENMAGAPEPCCN